MADDRFVMQKVEKTKCAECKLKKYEVCEREESEFMLCPVTNKTVAETIELHRGKTRAEYQYEFEESLLENICNREIREQVYIISKIVCDRLFGEGI